MMVGKLAGVLRTHPILVLFVEHLAGGSSSAAGINIPLDKVKDVSHPSFWNDGVAGGVRALRVMISGALIALRWPSSRSA